MDEKKSSSSTQQTVEDPVCGMSLNPDEAEQKFEYEGETYYFCCSECLREFQEDPDQYTI